MQIKLNINSFEERLGYFIHGLKFCTVLGGTSGICCFLCRPTPAWASTLWVATATSWGWGRGALQYCDNSTGLRSDLCEVVEAPLSCSDLTEIISVWHDMVPKTYPSSHKIETPIWLEILNYVSSLLFLIITLVSDLHHLC